jgi:hypothetical protein
MSTIAPNRLAPLFTQSAATPAIAFTVVMLAGLFQILLPGDRRYANLMPYPLISVGLGRHPRVAAVSSGFRRRLQARAAGAS